MEHDLVEAQISWRLGLALKATRVVGAEFDGPAPDRFVGDENAALKQHFLDERRLKGKRK